MSECLHSRDIFAVGTSRENRFSKPPLRTDKEMKKETGGNHDQEFDENGRVIMTKWFDNKPVLCASNFVLQENRSV
ncbi:hypothetical protein J6590_038236 [Homalodisca vitripennis]|nr:hypothetical protein J6590_038236 [Homalodisca vitripennis]